MALIKCKECGQQVSDKAKKCPNCGVSINDNIKIKILIVILTIINLFIFLKGFFTVNLTMIICSSILSVITIIFGIIGKVKKNVNAISILSIIISIVLVLGQCFIYNMGIKAMSNKNKQIQNTISGTKTLYEVVQYNITYNSGAYKYSISNIGNNFIVKYEYESSSGKTTGEINFTEKTIKEYEKLGKVQFIEIMNFDNNYNIISIHRLSEVMGLTTNDDIDINSSDGQSTITSKNYLFKDILGDYELNLCGKTTEQVKNETIDI